MTFLMLLIPALACALIVAMNMRAEKLVKNGEKEKAIASSLVENMFVPAVLVVCSILFYITAYLVFPIK